MLKEKVCIFCCRVYRPTAHVNDYRWGLRKFCSSPCSWNWRSDRRHRRPFTEAQIEAMKKLGQVPDLESSWRPDREVTPQGHNFRRPNWRVLNEGLVK